MLNKDPKKRPSVKRILEKDFLAQRIANLIPMSITKNELGETFVNKMEKKESVSQDKVLESNRNSSRQLTKVSSNSNLPISTEINLNTNDINLEKKSKEKENIERARRLKAIELKKQPQQQKPEG